MHMHQLPFYGPLNPARTFKTKRLFYNRHIMLNYRDLLSQCGLPILVQIVPPDPLTQFLGSGGLYILG